MASSVLKNFFFAPLLESDVVVGKTEASYDQVVVWPRHQAPQNERLNIDLQLPLLLKSQLRLCWVLQCRVAGHYGHLVGCTGSYPCKACHSDWPPLLQVTATCSMARAPWRRYTEIGWWRRGCSHQHPLMVASLCIWNRCFRPGYWNRGSKYTEGQMIAVAPSFHHPGSFPSAQLAAQQTLKECPHFPASFEVTAMTAH